MNIGCLKNRSDSRYWEGQVLKKQGTKTIERDSRRNRAQYVLDWKNQLISGAASASGGCIDDPLHVDDIDVEAPLERDLIFLRNRDVPGVIGKVGTILGEAEINIADFSLGRRTSEASVEPREAIAVVHVDGPVPDDVLKKLEEIPAVRQAKAVRLF